MCQGIYEINNNGSVIPFCVQQIYVATLNDRDSPNSIALCIKCLKMRVLTSDYKTCLNIREEISNLSLLNCKRLDSQGKCAEALDGIEIIDGKYSFTDQYYQNDRCAIASKNYESCLMPRFGYILDVKLQIIHKDHMKYPTFCQLYDSFLEKCIKYFDYFLPSEAPNGLSVYLNDFINAHLVDSAVSHSNQIVCFDNNKYFDTLNGCFHKDYSQPFQRKIHFCEQYLNRAVCKTCQSNVALQKNGQKCTNIFTSKCTNYDYIDLKQVCIQCQPFYRIQFFECIAMDHCKMLHPLNPNICIACESPYQLNELTNNCEKSYVSLDNSCELYSTNGNCLQCKQNDLNYLFQGHCVLRLKSQFCKNHDPNRDSCLTLECADEAYYASIQSKYFTFNYELPDIKEIALKNLIKYRFVAQIQFSIFCMKRINYPISGCYIYDSLYESCIQCENGLYLKRVELDDQTHSQFMEIEEEIKTQKPTMFICSKEYNYVPKQIQNCLKYSLDGIYCIQCQSGFYAAKTQCIQGISNCKVHENQEQCLECEEGYIPYIYRYDSQIFRKKCDKNSNLRDIQKPDGTLYNQGEINQNAVKSVANKKINCDLIYLGSVLFRYQKMCLSDAYFPDCQEAYYDNNNKIVCQTCRLRYIYHQNICFKDKIYDPIYSIDDNVVNVTKKCMSVINSPSSHQCEVNISDQLIINQPSVYGEKDDSKKYESSLCKIKNCQVCEYERCLKCYQSYDLQDQKICQKNCKNNNSTDEECDEQSNKEQDNNLTEKEQNQNKSGTENINKQKNNDQKQQDSSENRFIQILLIIAACLLAILLIFYLYRYARKKNLQNNQNNDNYQLFK